MGATGSRSTAPSARRMWTALSGQDRAKAESRADRFLHTAPTCSVCRGQIASPGRTKHYLCDTGTLIGKACSCPTGCSTTRWGNGPTPCDPNCLPCRQMKGGKFKTKRSTTN